MSNTQLFIPTKCKVGFNPRSDTYTGKLGYVIAHDGKKWRKELSWNNWVYKYLTKEEYNALPERQRYRCSSDKSIKPVEFDNIPTEGFVLNKDVGGDKHHYNVRNVYCRVYDPRGWEFEISIPNLLFILDNTSSIIGKGLEGSFIYSWDGKDLVLLPTNANEYKDCIEFTKLQSKKIKAKELIVGATYLNSKQVKCLYLGKFPYFDYNYRCDNKTGKIKYIFAELKEGCRPFITALSGITSIKELYEEKIHNDLADITNKFLLGNHASAYKGIENRPITKDLLKDLQSHIYHLKVYSLLNEIISYVRYNNGNYKISPTYSFSSDAKIITEDELIANYTVKYRVFENGYSYHDNYI